MSEVASIADQLRRAFNGKAWHGDSLLKILKDVTAAKAAAHPIDGAHSIWEAGAAYRGLGWCGAAAPWRKGCDYICCEEFSTRN